MSIEVRAQNTISMTSVKAIKDATDRSAQLLATMEQYAEDAGTTLTGIYQDAEDAKAGAISAKESAETALVNLSQVQSVLEVVEWVALHGEYSKTTDIAINPNKTYYTITATAVTTPTDDDISTYYELSNGSYVKTTDTTVVSGKTYYTVTGTPVASPVVADIGTYYELAVNEAMANYIQAHLALTNDGLYVMADNSEWRVLVASDGVYIIDPNNEYTNQMTATGNVVGYEDETHITIDSNSLDVVDNNGETVATFADDGITIGKVPTAGEYDADNLRWAYIDNYGFRVKAQSDDSPYDQIEMGGISRSKFGEVATYINKYVDEEWSVELDFVPLTGADITVTGYPTTSVTFPAGTPYSDASGRFYYDGNRTISCSGTSTASVRITYVYYSTAETKGGNYIFIGYHDDNFLHGDSTALFGSNLKAQTVNQVVIGKYNENDSNNAFEIGNGGVDLLIGEYRRNALEVTWKGNIHIGLPAYSSGSSQIDRQIYTSLVALGWDNDVLIRGEGE